MGSEISSQSDSVTGVRRTVSLPNGKVRIECATYTYEGQPPKNFCTYYDGIISYNDGSSYKGTVIITNSESTKNNYICRIYADGKGEFVNQHRDITYTGYFRMNKQHGYGKWTSKNETYEGNWDNGKKSGFCKITYPDGRVYEGNWEDREKVPVPSAPENEEIPTTTEGEP